MAVPTKTITTQTYEGRTVECVKFSCSEASDYRFEKVAPVNDNYQFQMVIRSTASKTLTLSLGGITRTITITSTMKRWTESFEGAVVTNSKDLEISFPTGDYWIYNVQLERGSSPSGWRPAPEDADEYADTAADQAIATANTYADLTAEQKAAAAVNAQTQLDIFNKLTNNGQTQGIYLSNNKVYINGTYIQTGTLSIKKGNIQTLYANADTGVIKIKADEFSLSDGTTLASVLSDANDHADVAAQQAVDDMTQLDVFNKLTNNGQTQGIYLSNSKVYINASYISTGTMSAARISGGTLTDTQGNMTWNLTTGAMTAKNLSITSTNFTLTSSGTITAKSGTIGGWYIESFGLYRQTSNVWTSYIGATGHITRSIAGSGSRSDWIAVFGDNFGVTNGGAFYCSSGYINNVTLMADCNPNAIAGKVITAATAQITTLITSTIDAAYIQANNAVLGHLSISGGGINSDTIIRSDSTISGNVVNGRNGFQTNGVDGITRSYVLKDPNGNQVLAFTLTNGILTSGSNTGTYTFQCTKTFYYTKSYIRFYAYADNSTTTRTYYNQLFVSDISTSAGTYPITL